MKLNYGDASQFGEERNNVNLDYRVYYYYYYYTGVGSGGGGGQGGHVPPPTFLTGGQ